MQVRSAVDKHQCHVERWRVTGRKPSAYPWLLGNDGRLAVLGEGPGTVVHDGSIVVLSSQRVDGATVVLVEVELVSLTKKWNAKLPHTRVISEGKTCHVGGKRAFESLPLKFQPSLTYILSCVTCIELTSTQLLILSRLRTELLRQAWLIVPAAYRTYSNKRRGA